MTTSQQDLRKPLALGIADGIGIAVFCVFLLAVSYLHSRHRMFWGDEIMGWLVLKAPDWKNVFRLWDAGIDSSGIWFYVLGRPWIAVFGASEVSLREFSAAGIAGSGAVLWIAARRYYSLLPVAASLLFVYGGSMAMSWQLANGRTYGIFLLANSLVMYLLLRGQDADMAKPSPLFLVATLAAYSFLAGSHILGFLYTAGYLGMQIAFDLYARRFRLLLYVSAACAFGVVLVSKANLLSTAALGKPTYWTPKPAIRDVLNGSVVLDERVLPWLLAITLVTLLFLRVRSLRKPVYALALGFVALDVLIFAMSRVSTSVYVDRYLLPFSLIGVLLFCEVLTQLREADAPWLILRSSIPLLLLLMAVYNLLAHSRQRPFYPLPDYTNDLLATLPAGVPIVDTDVASYVEVQFYHHDTLDRPFRFPVDWAVALDPANTGGVSGFHEMDNFKATGLYADGIVPSEKILERDRDFVVLVSSHPTQWFKRRILADPRYRVTSLGTHDGGIYPLDMYRVHRID